MSPISIINSQDTAAEFHTWLETHEEITNIQGLDVVRREYFVEYIGGRLERRVMLVGFSFGDKINYAYMEYLWKERKMLNDWIRRFNSHNA